MAATPPRKRDRFRHGYLPKALVRAALARLESGGVESISLRELAADVGVNHRAVYRHFPGKLSVLASAAEHAWQQFGERVKKSTTGKASGEDVLIAASLSLFGFAREFPNLYHLMAAERVNLQGKFPKLDAAMFDALQVFAVGFAGTGMAP